MALRATPGYQQSLAIMTFGTKNAFNSMKWRAILPALASLIPSLVPFALNLNARGPPQPLFKTVTGETEVLPSSTVVQQGCNLGPLCYSAGALDRPREFQDNPPVAEAQIPSYIDDIVILVPPQQADNAKAVEAVTSCLQQRMEPLSIVLNFKKFRILCPPGTCVDQWPEDSREILALIQLTVASTGFKIVGIPVREETDIDDEVHERVVLR